MVALDSKKRAAHLLTGRRNHVSKKQVPRRGGLAARATA
jgi:hypothetical protein